MSSMNNHLSIDPHNRVRKSNSTNAEISENSSTENGEQSNAARSTSNVMVENLRDVRLVGHGYRRSIDFLTRPESNLAHSPMDGGEISGQQTAQTTTQTATGDGKKATMMQGGSVKESDGKQTFRAFPHSPSADSLESKVDGINLSGYRNSNLDGTKNQRRGSVGDDAGINDGLSMDRVEQSVRFLASASGVQQGASVAPYHLSRVVPLPSNRQPLVRYQQTTPRRQGQPPQLMPRPAALVRLTRNGPFCPCFSPNDSDTEPSSPVAEHAVVAAPNNSSGRNMASLARELRTRFMLNAGRPMAPGPFVPNPNTRRVATEAMQMLAEPYPVHTQVEYTHYLVPDLLEITRAPYYWGVMDRFEAERLLDNQPEGTFLLRDSAQSEYLFSVSFRRYNRTLHARIEQMNHKFSFDSSDQGVFSADTVTGLIEHYKDPSKFLFFEPQLSIPLPRKFAFPLQHLCRSVIASRMNYNDINKLEVPKKFKDYMREYHYKHPVRVTKLD